MTLKEKINYCRGCSYARFLIGLGQGVRCYHPENQKYDKHNQSVVLVGDIPDNCKFKIDK